MGSGSNYGHDDRSSWDWNGYVDDALKAATQNKKLGFVSRMRLKVVMFVASKFSAEAHAANVQEIIDTASTTTETSAVLPAIEVTPPQQST